MIVFPKPLLGQIKRPPSQKDKIRGGLIRLLVATGSCELRKWTYHLVELPTTSCAWRWAKGLEQVLGLFRDYLTHGRALLHVRQHQTTAVTTGMN